MVIDNFSVQSDKNTKVLCFSALKIHVSPTCHEYLKHDEESMYLTTPRGEINFPVRNVIDYITETILFTKQPIIRSGFGTF